MANLTDLKSGESGKIKSILLEKNRKLRLMIFGLTKGTIITLHRIAPLGDPLDVVVRNFHLLIGRKEAEKIIIEKNL